MFASLFFKEEERYRQRVFTIVNYGYAENLILEHEQNGTKLKQWKIVANEKPTAEIGELNSVKNLFWVKHATKNACNIPKRKIFEWNDVAGKMNWLHWAILKN